MQSTTMWGLWGANKLECDAVACFESCVNAYQHDVDQHDAYQHDAYQHDAYQHDAYQHDAYQHDAYQHDVDQNLFKANKLMVYTNKEQKK